MRKIKYIKEEFDINTVNLGIKILIMVSLVRGFSEILVWNQFRTKTNNMMDKLIELSKKNKKIDFSPKIIFNDYQTSYLAKWCVKKYIELIEDKYKGKVKKFVENNISKFIKVVEDDAMDLYMKLYRRATMHDDKEIKEMVRDFCRLRVCLSNLLKIQKYEYEKMTRVEKTFFTKANNWIEDIHMDILGG